MAAYEKEKAEREAAEAAAAKAEEEKKMRDRIKRIVGESGMGDRFLRRTFSTFQLTDDNKRAAAAARRYAEGFDAMLPQPGRQEPGRNGLFIAGPPGTGKTHLAAAIANHLIAQGKPVICMTMIDLLERIKRTYSTTGGSESDVLKIYKTVPLLVIDDIGKEPPTEWAISTVYNIINGRYEAYLPTIVTTNYDTEALIDRMTQSVITPSSTVTVTLTSPPKPCAVPLSVSACAMETPSTRQHVRTSATNVLPFFCIVDPPLSDSDVVFFIYAKSVFLSSICQTVSWVALTSYHKIKIFVSMPLTSSENYGIVNPVVKTWSHGSVGRTYWLMYITLEASGHNASDFGRMAQLVEHIVHIDGVTGSSPVATTTSSVRNDRGFLFAFHSGICRRSPLPSKVRRQNAYNCNKKSHAERDACGMGFLYLLICPRRNPWREEQQRAAH